MFVLAKKCRNFEVARIRVIDTITTLLSETTFEPLLRVREVFHYTYRSPEGFGRNIFPIPKVMDALVSNCTSLCERFKSLNDSLKVYDYYWSLDLVMGWRFTTKANGRFVNMEEAIIEHGGNSTLQWMLKLNKSLHRMITSSCGNVFIISDPFDSHWRECCFFVRRRCVWDTFRSYYNLTYWFSSCDSTEKELPIWSNWNLRVNGIYRNNAVFIGGVRLTYIKETG